MDTNKTLENQSQSSFGLIQIGIVLLALAAAVIHGVVLNILMGAISPLFTLNGLGYLTLLVAYFLPWSILQNNRNIVRWIFIGYAALTILAWVVLVVPGGNWTGDTLGLITKGIEALLIVFLFIDGRQ